MCIIIINCKNCDQWCNTRAHCSGDYQKSSRFLIMFKCNTYMALLESCLMCRMYETIDLSLCLWWYEVLCTNQILCFVCNRWILSKSVVLGKCTYAIVASLYNDKYVVLLLMCICEFCFKVRYHRTARGQDFESPCAHVHQYTLSFDSVAFCVFSFIVPLKAERQFLAWQ
jgi:hypothetical protein